MTMLVQSPRGGVGGQGLRRGLLTGTDSPGHGGLVRLEAAALQNPGVGGDQVPRLQQDHVPGHQLAAGIFVTFPSTEGGGWGGG